MHRAVGVVAVLFALLTAAPVLAQAAPVQGYRVVHAYPHDRGAFTQGLLWRDGVLYESTGRTPSTIRKVRLEDGQVLERREIADVFFGEGMVDWGDRLYSLTWRNGLGFIWSIDGFRPLGGFTYAGEGWGLTRDDRRLILSDGSADLRFLDPGTFAETGRVTVIDDGVPVRRLNELEWVDGEVLANVWQTDRIARIDPATGRVKAWIDLSGLLPAGTVEDPNDDVLNGIAWDPAGRRLFVTGKNWPTLFQIEIVP